MNNIIMSLSVGLVAVIGWGVIFFEDGFDDLVPKLIGYFICSSIGWVLIVGGILIWIE